jgi:DeoR/GlpR family transcriptional regulator of sugar metabolism
VFMKERHDLIIQEVNENGRVTVTELAERFGVSEDSIRRDLGILADQGLLERVYGGAVSVQTLPDRNIAKRTEAAGEKHAIAAKAYQQIEDGDTIYLDVSTTVLALAELVGAGNKRVTAVSNSLDILHALAQNPLVTAIGTGGNVHALQNAFVGSATLQMLESYSFDRVFIGAAGVNLDDGGVTTFEADDGIIKSCVIKHSKASYLLFDQQKLRRNGAYRFASVSEVSCVVCDELSDKARKVLEDEGVDCL